MNDIEFQYGKEVAHYTFKLADMEGEVGRFMDENSSNELIRLYLMTCDDAVIESVRTYIEGLGFAGAVQTHRGQYWTDVTANILTTDPSLSERIVEHFGARRWNL